MATMAVRAVRQATEHSTWVLDARVKALKEACEKGTSPQKQLTERKVNLAARKHSGEQEDEQTAGCPCAKTRKGGVYWKPPYCL